MIPRIIGAIFRGLFRLFFGTPKKPDQPGDGTGGGEEPVTPEINGGFDFFGAFTAACNVLQRGGMIPIDLRGLHHGCQASTGQPETITGIWWRPRGAPRAAALPPGTRVGVEVDTLLADGGVFESSVFAPTRAVDQSNRGAWKPIGSRSIPWEICGGRYLLAVGQVAEGPYGQGVLSQVPCQTRITGLRLTVTVESFGESWVFQSVLGQ